MREQSVDGCRSVLQLHKFAGNVERASKDSREKQSEGLREQKTEENRQPSLKDSLVITYETISRIRRRQKTDLVDRLKYNSRGKRMTVLKLGILLSMTLTHSHFCIFVRSIYTKTLKLLGV